MPPYDADSKLMALQIDVANKRVAHEDLVRRRDLMRRVRCWASYQALELRTQRAFNELRAASEALASYISKKQRGVKT